MTKKSTHTFNATKAIKSNAKILRHSETSAEAVMWRMVRNKNVEGLKFRRQHPIDNFIADFYCHELKLVIELDGNIHEIDSVKQKDIYKESKLKNLGISVLRFSNDDVFRNPDWVINEIIAFKKAHKNPHP